MGRRSYVITLLFRCHSLVLLAVADLPSFSHYHHPPPPPSPPSSSSSAIRRNARPEMSGSFSTPINTALLMYILYTVQSIVYPPVKSSSSSSSTESKTTNATTPSKRFPTEFKNGYTWLPATHPQSVLYKVYTPTTLAPFDGVLLFLLFFPPLPPLSSSLPIFVSY